MELWVPGSALDRVGDARVDPQWVRQLWAEPETSLLGLSGDGRVPLAGGRLRLRRPAEPYDEQRHFLVGRVDGRAVFTVEEAVDEAAEVGRLAVRGLSDTERDIAITALALVNWHRVAPHCGICGAMTGVGQGGHVRHCAACRRDRFPRTDPAVITAIVDADDRLLLAHNVAWEPHRLSLVAGFVDAGESLEACVRREVFEEVGVELAQVRYVASQPWPFPRSLMLGFVARAVSPAIRVDGVEIDRAEFVSRADYDARLADGRLGMPTSASIAATLIGLWRSGELPC